MPRPRPAQPASQPDHPPPGHRSLLTGVAQTSGYRRRCSTPSIRTSKQLAALTAEQGWGATVAVVSRLAPSVFEARNPFPPGGVREDPATSSAAAALGGYLRALGLVEPPTTLTVHPNRRRR